MEDSLIYKLALAQAAGIGDISAKKMLAYCGSVESIFNEKRRLLLKIPGIGKATLKNLMDKKNLELAEKEIAFMERYRITPLFYTDQEYPSRLKNCEDGPVLLFLKGNVNLEKSKIISMVGTRSATDYGKELCRKLISDIRDRNHDAIIVSGLAYGIDIHAHKAALEHELETVAVLAHGLNSIYPAAHRNMASKIAGQGALVTDFLSFQKAERPNFIKRNRIIAGISDATIVVESGEKGGALITADIANSYNRDVFAFPGKINDKYSAGCNKLIKIHRAALLESIHDLEYIMNWKTSEEKQEAVQQKLFDELTVEEKGIMVLLEKEKSLSLDQLCDATGLAIGKISPVLLNLELMGLIKSLPGKFYQLRL